MVHTVLYRCCQTELVETDRAQAPDHVTYSAVHVVDAADDGQRGRRRELRVAATALTDGHGIELDCIEILPKLIVQLTRHMFALHFLYPQIFLCESTVLGQHAGKLRLGQLPRPQLTTGLAISAPGKPDETDCKHQQSNGQLVELNVLPVTCERVQRFGELKMCGQDDAQGGKTEHDRSLG